MKKVLHPFILRNSSFILIKKGGKLFYTVLDIASDSML